MAKGGLTINELLRVGRKSVFLAGRSRNKSRDRDEIPAFPNTEQFKTALKAATTVAKGYSPETVAELSALGLPYSKRGKGTIFKVTAGVPASVQSWITTDMTRFYRYLDAAVMDSPPRWLDALPPEDVSAITFANQRWLSENQRREIVRGVKAREGQTLKRFGVIGSRQYWDESAVQRLPEDIRDRLRVLNNYALVNDPSPVQRAVEELMSAAGVGTSKTREAASWQMWNDSWKSFLTRIAASPAIEGTAARGAGSPQPVLAPDPAQVELVKAQGLKLRASEWPLVRLSERASSALWKKDARSDVEGLPRYLPIVLRDGTMLSKSVAASLERAGDASGAAKWREFMSGRGEPAEYDKARAGLDGLVQKWSAPKYEHLRLTMPSSTNPSAGYLTGNPKGATAFMWRAKDPLMEVARLRPGGIESEDARVAQLSAKMRIYGLSLLRQEKPSGILKFRDAVLPYLPEDARLEYMNEPHEMMQKMASFFERPASSSEKVSKVWAKHMVSAAQGGAVRPDTPVGKVALQTLRAYYDEAKNAGVPPTLSGATDAVEAALRRESYSDPVLKRMVRKGGELNLSGGSGQVSRSLSFVHEWLGVPLSKGVSDPKMPSWEQFDLVHKILTGVTPAAAVGFLWSQHGLEDMSDLDVAYLLRRQANGGEQSRSVTPSFPPLPSFLQPAQPMGGLMGRLTETYNGQGQATTA